MCSAPAQSKLFGDIADTDTPHVRCNHKLSNAQVIHRAWKPLGCIGVCSTSAQSKPCGHIADADMPQARWYHKLSKEHESFHKAWQPFGCVGALSSPAQSKPFGDIADADIPRMVYRGTSAQCSRPNQPTQSGVINQWQPVLLQFRECVEVCLQGLPICHILQTLQVLIFLRHQLDDWASGAAAMSATSSR